MEVPEAMLQTFYLWSSGIFIKCKPNCKYLLHCQQRILKPDKMAIEIEPANTHRLWLSVMAIEMDPASTHRLWLSVIAIKMDTANRHSLWLSVMATEMDTASTHKSVSIPAPKSDLMDSNLLDLLH